MTTATHGQPAVGLNTGVELPALGFGVFQTPPRSEGSVKGNGSSLAREDG